MANPNILSESPTIWSEDLQAHYTRELQLLDRNIDARLKRDEQQYKRDTSNTLVDFLEKGAHLAPSIAKLTKGNKENQKKKIHQDLKGLNLGGDAAPILGKLLKSSKDERAALLKEGTEFAERLAKLNPNQRKYLLDLHGSKQIIAQNYLAGLHSQTIDSSFVNDINEDSKLQSEYLSAQSKFNDTGDTTDLESVLRVYASEKFGDVYLHKGVLHDNAATNLNSWVKTKLTKNKNQVTKLLVQEKNATLNDNINVHSKNPEALRQYHKFEHLKQAAILDGRKDLLEGGDNEIQFTDSGAFITGEYIEGLNLSDTSMQKAGKILGQRYIELGHKGELTQIELDGLLAKGGVKDHPAGDSMEVFFPEETLAKMQSAVTSGTIMRTGIATAAREAGWEKTAANAITTHTNPETRNETDLRNTIGILKSQGADEKVTKPLERILNNDTAPNSYERHKKLNQHAIDTGLMDMSMEEIKDIPNVKLSTELQEMKLVHEKAQEDIDFKNETKSMVDEFVEKPDVVTMRPNGTFPAQQQKVHNEITTFAEETVTDLINAVDKEGNPLYRGGDLKRKLEEVVDAHVAKHSGEGGKYEKDVNGDFKNYKAHNQKLNKLFEQKQQLIETARTQPTKASMQKWDSGLFASIDELGGPDEPNIKIKVAGTAETCVSGQEFSGMIAAGQYSAKLKYQAKQLGLAPWQLFELQLKSLIETKPEVAKQYGLDDIETPKVEKDFYNGLAGHPRYQAQVRDIGLENMTPKQLQKMAFAFVNNDFDQAKYVWGQRGIPINPMLNIQLNELDETELQEFN